MTDLDLGIRFFLQLLVILLACRAAGYLGKYLGQTQVVSEMIAGVVLGPSLFGLFFPDAAQWLFPKFATIGDAKIAHPSMQILYVVSQLGLVLYMFVVGLEFDFELLKAKSGGIVLVSMAGIIAPIVLGGLAGAQMHSMPGFFGEKVNTLSAGFYVGAAMAITAFPMLARIIYERGIAKTPMGTMALGAAAIDDATAWCLLSIVLSSVHSSANYALLAIGGGLVIGVVAFVLGRPLLRHLETWCQTAEGLSPALMTVVFATLMGFAYATDVIGIYAVFGAFLCGVVMPRGMLSHELQNKLEIPVTTLLLPLFFVYSGLNTKISLINTPQLWLITVGLVLIAFLCKGGACLLAARLAGQTWRDSAKIGTLMNARGLIELIILNIGLQNGVITPTLFTMMVIVAIVTTLIASPLFAWLHKPAEGMAPPITSGANA